MKRTELEALSTPVLQQLIVDAVAVLTDRASGATQAAGSRATAGTGSLFTFGSATAASQDSSFPAANGLFSSADSQQAKVGNIFGTPATAFPPRTSAESAASTGGGKLFGGTGGGLFGGVAGAAVPTATAGGSTGDNVKGETAKASGGEDKANGEADPNDGADDDEAVNEEEVTVVQGWSPSITLEVTQMIETGEEGEELLYEQRSKLYRWRNDEWKERGLGDARILKDKATGRVRFLLRQEKTGKVVANHYVIDRKPYCDLVLNKDSEKIWVWTAQDFSEEEAAVEKFALKFGNPDLAGAFKEAFNDAKQRNAPIFNLEESEQQ